MGRRDRRLFDLGQLALDGIHNVMRSRHRHRRRPSARTWARTQIDVAHVDVGHLPGLDDLVDDHPRAQDRAPGAGSAPFTNVAVPTAQGLYFTAIRSGTGMGVEVNSSGGSFLGKKTSWMFSQRSAPDGLLFEGFAEEGVEFDGLSWIRDARLGFRPVSVRHLPYLPLALLPFDPGVWGRSGTRLILPLCVTASRFVAAFVTPLSGVLPGQFLVVLLSKSHILRSIGLPYTIDDPCPLLLDLCQKNGYSVRRIHNPAPKCLEWTLMPRPGHPIRRQEPDPFQTRHDRKTRAAQVKLRMNQFSSDLRRSDSVPV